MKKIFLFGMLGCMALSIQAKVLRVSNVTGSNAPYTTYADAEAAAEEGDTIVFEGSNIVYPAITISKKLVVMGSGYYLVENGISQVNGQVATVEGVTISAAEAKLQSLKVKGVNVTADKVIINKCHVYDAPITLEGNYVVVHQNLITGTSSSVRGKNSETVVSNIQITNNIWTSGGLNYSEVLMYLTESYIAYNTCTSNALTPWYRGVSNCVFEGNLLPKAFEAENSIFKNEYYFSDKNDVSSTPFKDWKTDADIKAVYDLEENSIYLGYGAFAGTDPYVISGVPAGPVIEDVTMPVSVEQGKPLEVTVKVKIQQ